CGSLASGAVTDRLPRRLGVDPGSRELLAHRTGRERGILRLLLISVRQTVQSAPSATRFVGPSASLRSPAPTAACPIGPNAGSSAGSGGCPGPRQPTPASRQERPRGRADGRHL